MPRVLTAAPDLGRYRVSPAIPHRHPERLDRTPLAPSAFGAVAGVRRFSTILRILHFLLHSLFVRYDRTHAWTCIAFGLRVPWFSRAFGSVEET